MRFPNVRWSLAIAGILAAEVVLIAAAFGWVAIYSYLLNPGQPSASYQDYAQTASPYVALLLGIPVFFMTCRWIGVREPARAWPTAMALFGIYFAIEAPLMLTADNAALTAWFAAVNFPVKFLSCHFGAKSAMRVEASRRA